MEPDIPAEWVHKYNVKGRIGGGSFGNVYKGVWEDGKVIALKVVPNVAEEGFEKPNGIPADTIREVFLLKSFDHPNIIKMFDVDCDKDRVCYALEYMEFDLKKYMDYPTTEMTWDRIKIFMRHLLSAIKYCHEEKVMHRDLKPENLLVDEKGTILKVTDFGKARTCTDSREKFTGGIQTSWYKAPEVILKSTTYSYGIDVWSIGCIFAEMVNNKVLFKPDDEKKTPQLAYIFSILGTPDEQTLPGVTSDKVASRTNYNPRDLSEIVPGLEGDGIDLLSKLLCLDPRKRISASEALKHPYFQLVPGDGKADSSA